jgi:hypothetical protein
MFSAMRTPLGCVLGLALAGLVLGACGDDDQPSTLPDVTPSTTSVESPSATPSGNPTAQLEAEITAFLEQYAEAINESWTSEDALARRREMFADTCESCLAGWEFAQRAHSEALRFVGGTASISKVRVDRVDDDVVTVSAFTNSEPGDLLTAEGELVQHFDGAIETQISYQVRREKNGAWIILLGEVLT